MDYVLAGKSVGAADLGGARRAAVQSEAFVVEGGAGSGMDGTVLIVTRDFSRCVVKGLEGSGGEWAVVGHICRGIGDRGKGWGWLTTPPPPSSD